MTGIRATNVWFRVPGGSPLVCVTNAFLFSVPSIGSDSITIHGTMGLCVCLLSISQTDLQWQLRPQSCHFALRAPLNKAEDSYGVPHRAIETVPGTLLSSCCGLARKPTILVSQAVIMRNHRWSGWLLCKLEVGIRRSKIRGSRGLVRMLCCLQTITISTHPYPDISW